MKIINVLLAVVMQNAIMNCIKFNMKSKDSILDYFNRLNNKNDIEHNRKYRFSEMNLQNTHLSSNYTINPSDYEKRGNILPSPTEMNNNNTLTEMNNNTTNLVEMNNDTHNPLVEMNNNTKVSEMYRDVPLDVLQLTEIYNKTHHDPNNELNVLQLTEINNKTNVPHIHEVDINYPNQKEMNDDLNPKIHEVDINYPNQKEMNDDHNPLVYNVDINYPNQKKMNKYLNPHIRHDDSHPNDLNNDILSYPHINHDNSHPDEISIDQYPFINHDNSHTDEDIKDINDINHQPDLYNEAKIYTPPTIKNNDKSINTRKEIFILEDSLSIRSFAFSNKFKYPHIRLNNDSFRINNKTKDIYFLFKLMKDNIIYISNQNEIQVLDSINLSEIKNLEREDVNCFNIFTNNSISFKLCSKTTGIRNIWYCELANLLKKHDPFCKRVRDFKERYVELENTTIQPILLVPEVSRNCNENFNYSKNGMDWECQCSDGQKQSPINVNTREVSNLTLLNSSTISIGIPNFYFEPVNTDENRILIKYIDKSIRIKHSSFGKIVTYDGDVLIMQEIIFKTPSEHQIDGKTFDMEMQVIAYGISGYIDKQAVLSILFRKEPGAYNKFIDDVNFFNLPNIDYKTKHIQGELFIPKVFHNSNDLTNDYKPFSFYTYEGSLTSPPCTERTTYYIVDEPVPIAENMIRLLKEAIMDDTDNGIKSVNDYFYPQNISNARSIQKLNNRKVYYFDSGFIKNDINNTREQSSNEDYHYEKIKVKKNKYVRVLNNNPSNVPNSFIVTERETYN